MFSEYSALPESKLEVHYFFSDESHSMDATVLNRCDYELLGVMKELATALSLEITIETEPIAEGGIKKWFKILHKGEDKNATITTAIFTVILTTIITASLGKALEKLVEKVFEDTEMTYLQKEKLKQEINVLKQYQSSSLEDIDYNIALKKRRSNFYEQLNKYPKVTKVSFSAVDDEKQEKISEKFVNKSEFNDFILTTNDLPVLVEEEAVIEIIAPVLKKENHRWLGHYNGKSVPFNMKSDEFKNLVQNGKVEFRNGSSIVCRLEIKRKVNNEGVVLNVGYDVIRVNYYFQNDRPLETKEGKHHRQVKEAQKAQLELFSQAE